MKFLVLSCGLFCCLLFPGASRAQHTGRIECARNDGYVYLYSSLTTLEVRATLQCGETVQISSLYDNYYAVRDAKGETGYVPLPSVVVLKDQPGTGLQAPEAPARERIHYDDSSHEKSGAGSGKAVAGFTLAKGTPIHVKLSKTISSATAHVGDPLEFEVLEDVQVDGVVVIAKGSKASGVLSDVELKKRFGHSGKLAFNITSVRLVDGAPVPLRCFQETTGGPTNSSDAVLPLASGKDAAIPQDTEFTALVESNTPLKREAFVTPDPGSSTVPLRSPQN